MPFIKNIGIQTSKTAAEAPSLIVTLSSTATGSSGYFTSSNGVLYTGASVNTPSNVTYFITASGGTQPYTIEWSSSIAYSGGYPSANNSSSFTLQTYAGEQDQWTVKVIDSSTPSTIASASIDTIVFGDDPPSLNVSILGSDTPTFQSNDIYGSTAAPLRTIGAAIKYAIPSETIIYVASGTYAENPLYSKYVEISGSSSPGLGSGNYFIYDTTWNRTTSSLALSRPINGFTEQSFAKIEVSPSGSIQRAIYDVSSSGLVSLQAGVYVVSSSILLHNANNTINSPFNEYIKISGVPIPTGSGTFVQDMSPTTILRTPNDQTILFRAVFMTYDYNTKVYISNMALETYLSSSFIKMDASTNKTVLLESIRFRTISSSVAYDRLALYRQSGTSIWCMSELGASVIDRNITKHDLFVTSSGPIFDSEDNPAFFGGRVLFGPYAPINHVGGNGNTLVDRMNYWDADSAQNVFTGSRTQRIYGTVRSNTRIAQNAGTSTTRPRFGLNQPLYNGRPYLHFGNDGASSNDFLNAGNAIAVNSTSSGFGMLVFSPTSLSSERGVIYKNGDDKFGYSFVMTGSNISIGVYSSDDNFTTGTSSAFILAPVTIGTEYLAEWFFNGNGTTKRVGIALYGTSSMITSSYFSSTQYSVNQWKLNPTVLAQNDAIGAGIGYFKSFNYINNTNTSLQDYYTGTFGAMYSDFSASVHTDKHRKEVFDFLRLRFFPTSSYVSHSLFADT